MRILASLRPSQIRERLGQLEAWVKQNSASELTAAEVLEAITTDPLERLKFTAVLSVGMDLRSAPFGLDAIRQVLVWGEDYSDPKAYLEYQPHKPQAAEALRAAGFHENRRSLYRAQHARRIARKEAL